MKRQLLSPAGFLLLLVSILILARGDNAYASHYSGRHHGMTEKGLFQVTLIIDDIDLNVGMNSFDMLVQDKDERHVADAQIEITPWMPEMSHGVASKARIYYKGDGIYRVDDLEANMPGRWEFKVHIKTQGAEDVITFTFPSIPMEQDGTASGAASP